MILMLFDFDVFLIEIKLNWTELKYKQNKKQNQKKKKKTIF